MPQNDFVVVADDEKEKNTSANASNAFGVVAHDNANNKQLSRRIFFMPFVIVAIIHLFIQLSSFSKKMFAVPLATAPSHSLPPPPHSPIDSVETASLSGQFVHSLASIY